MQDEIIDAALGRLVWDEDAETYRGAADFPTEKNVALNLVLHNADEVRPREFKSFLAAVRTHFESLRNNDSRYRTRAVETTARVLRKLEKPVEEAKIAGRLRLHTLTMDNAGISVLYYDAGDLLPPKQRFIAVAFDMSGEIHLSKAMRRPE